jgi:hypothetical protein
LKRIVVGTPCDNWRVGTPCDNWRVAKAEKGRYKGWKIFVRMHVHLDKGWKIYSAKKKHMGAIYMTNKIELI